MLLAVADLEERFVDAESGEGAFRFPSRVAEVPVTAAALDEAGAVDDGSRELEGDRALRRAKVAPLFSEDCV